MPTPLRTTAGVMIFSESIQKMVVRGFVWTGVDFNQAGCRETALRDSHVIPYIKTTDPGSLRSPLNLILPSKTI
jgi:hypothetical protein